MTAKHSEDDLVGSMVQPWNTPNQSAAEKEAGEAAESSFFPVITLVTTTKEQKDIKDSHVDLFSYHPHSSSM